MILSALILSCGIAAFLQSSLSRFYTALIFFGAIAVHDAYLSDLEGFPYYGSAAFFDLMTIMWISVVRPISRMAIVITNLSFVSIVVNMLGWLAWYMYQPPLVYNAVFVALYFAAFIVLLIPESMYDRFFKRLFRWNLIFYNNLVSRVIKVDLFDKGL